MEKLEQLMQIYHAIYLVCLFFFLIFLSVAVFLAVRWKIWEAVGILSGRTAMKAIRHGTVMKEAKKPVKSKRLRQDEINLPYEQKGKSTLVLNAGENGEHFGITEHLEEEHEGLTSQGMLILAEIKEIHSTERI